MKKELLVKRLITVAVLVAVSACGQQTSEQLIAAAKESLAKKDANSAAIHLRTALQKNTSSVEARLMLGQLLLNGGDSLGAAVELEKAAELGAPDNQTAPLLARAMFAQGQFEKLLKRFLNTKLSDPAGQVDLETTIASAYLAINDWTEAENRINAVLQRSPKEVSALLVKIRLLARTSRLPEAQRAMSVAEELAPNNPDVWSLKGTLLAVSTNRDDLKQALVAYGKALELQPNQIFARGAMIMALLSLRDTKAAEEKLAELIKFAPNHPQTKLFQARFAAEKGDLGKAREMAQFALKYLPRDPQALYIAGDIDFRRGALTEAESLLGKALVEAPELAAARLLLSQTYIRAGKADKVVPLLQPLLAGNSAVAIAANTVAAEAMMVQGQGRQAEQFFKHVISMSPNDVRVQTAMAVTQISNGRFQEGVSQLRDIAAKDASTVADLALVDAYVRAKDWKQALLAIEALGKKSQDKPTPAFLQGRVLLEMGDRGGAREAFKRSLQADPAYFPSTLELSRLDLFDKKPEDAQARFERHLEKNPNDLRALMAIYEMRVVAQDPYAKLVERLNNAIKLHPTETMPRVALVTLQLDRGLIKEAVASGQSAVAAIPTDAPLLELLGRAQRAAGDGNQARSTFGRLATLIPRSPVPLVLSADLLVSEGDSKGAQALLKRALVLQENYLPAQRALFAIELIDGRVASAQDIARQVAKQRPREAIGQLLLGDVEFRQKRWRAAADAYKVGLRVEPNSELAIRLHRTLSKLDKDDAAKFEAEWVKDHGRDASFLHYAGDMAFSTQDMVKAEQRYRQVIELWPSNAMVLNNLATILVSAQRTGAVELAERAVKAAPSCYACWDTLASAHAQSGDHAKALEAQKTALDIAPDNAALRFGYAKHLFKSGDKARAATELAKVAGANVDKAIQAEVDELRRAWGVGKSN